MTRLMRLSVWVALAVYIAVGVFTYIVRVREQRVIRQAREPHAAKYVTEPVEPPGQE